MQGFQILLPPFPSAAREGSVEKMEAIFNTLSESEQEAVINALEPNYPRFGQTPLVYAIQSKKFEAVKWLLAHGASLNLQDSDGNTPLHCAVFAQNFKVVYHLLRMLAVNNLEMQNNNQGEGPLSWLIKSFEKKPLNSVNTAQKRSLTERFFTAILGNARDRTHGKRTLYAFLLNGIDVKKGLDDIKDVSEAQKQEISECVIEAEQYIKYLQSYGLSKALIAVCVLGSKQEEEAFLNEASGLHQICKFNDIRNNISVPSEIKDLILSHNRPDFFKLEPKKLPVQLVEDAQPVSLTLHR